MANEYVQVEQLKATLEMSGQTFADSDIDAAVKAASRGIDNACSRRFWADTTANARVFTSMTAGYLSIDDLYAITSIATDPASDGTYEETWLTTDYVLEPVNAPADGWPWTALRTRPDHSWPLPTDTLSGVKITGKWGWAAVPDPIVEATTILASKLLRRAREAPFGVVSAGIDVGVVMRIARSDPDVSFLVGPYTRGALLLV